MSLFLPCKSGAHARGSSQLFAAFELRPYMLTIKSRSINGNGLLQGTCVHRTHSSDNRALLGFAPSTVETRKLSLRSPSPAQSDSLHQTLPLRAVPRSQRTCRRLHAE